MKDKDLRANLEMAGQGCGGYLRPARVVRGLGVETNTIREATKPQKAETRISKRSVVYMLRVVRPTASLLGAEWKSHGWAEAEQSSRCGEASTHSQDANLAPDVCFGCTGEVEGIDE
jgi:hypothetical protein